MEVDRVLTQCALSVWAEGEGRGRGGEWEWRRGGWRGRNGRRGGEERDTIYENEDVLAWRRVVWVCHLCHESTSL